jgi:O-antigen ligase/polysaccharide polymerase Wzy-like membrane protein
MILRFGIGAAVVAMALDGGSYGLTSRTSLGVAVWWVLLIAFVFAVWPFRRAGRPTLAAAAGLAALAAWTLASVTWAPSAEHAFQEFDRTVLYFGVLLLAAVGVRRANLSRACDGLAIGVVGVALLALGSRLFPDLMPTSEVPRLLPGTETRLMYPLNYWNGLAVLMALGVPLLLRAAVAAQRQLTRALALSFVPLLSLAIFLASSRGGIAAAVLASAAYVALTARRWQAATAIVAAAAGTAAAVLVVLGEPVLVDGPFESAAAVDAGRRTAVVLALICGGLGVASWLVIRFAGPFPRVRPLVGWAAAIAILAPGVVVVAASHPVARAKAFTETPDFSQPSKGFVTTHILSGAGGGRWQFWTAALNQFESRPITGDGAGSYEAWWAQHASFPYFVRDAHSLYLETLGELGVPGLLLISGLVLFGIAAGARAATSSRGAEREDAAALTALFAAFAAAAAIDWMWEMTVVAVVALAALGLLLGPASTVRLAEAPRVRQWQARLGVIAIVVLCWLLVFAQAVPLLTQLELEESQAAVRRGDATRAREAAVNARNIQPWAVSPPLQLALVYERFGDLARARASVREAIKHDQRDWRLWLVAARIETRRGAIAAATRDLERARNLNPRSPIFSP